MTAYGKFQSCGGERRALAAAVLLAATLPGCAPVFSELQSAKLVGKRHVEVTGSASYVSFAQDGDSNHLQDHYGVQVATGVHDRLDLRARYENVQVVDAGGVNVVGLGLKLGLVRDRVALYVPVGFAFGSGIDAGKTAAVHPTLLLTAPVQRSIELNASAKYLVPLSQDGGDKLVAFNLGLGVGPNIERWAIRPEVGFLFDPGEKGHYTQFSLGLSYRPK